MMRNFFQSLEKHKVRYLLISGQASVLYGAAQFSEDIDLWIAPTASNLQAFLGALRSMRATIYKLTPPMKLPYFRRGHGFHFRLPEDEFAPTYLDVMGRPPRVGSFLTVSHRALRMDCDWGRIPVIAISDLVDVKKTRRLADYDVISNLVKIKVNSVSNPDSRLLLWALKNTFRLEDAMWILRRWPQAKQLTAGTQRQWVRQISLQKLLSVEDSMRVRTLLAQEIAENQTRDILYWSPIIDELRELRKKGLLLPEGLPVTDL